MDKKLKLLEKIYTNPKSPAAFSGIESLFREAKKHDKSISKEDILYFLEGNRTYTLHRPRRLHFKRSKTIPSGYMTDVQVDLADFQKLAKHNKGYKYMLVAIDVLSKQLFVVPAKTKSYKDMVEAFDLLLNKMPIIPHTIFSDRGAEFLLTNKSKNKGAENSDYFKEHDILKYKSSTKTIKAALAERAIRNIKQRLYRYFSEKHTLNWIEVLPEIIEGINNSYSRPIGMKPADVNFKNAQSVWNKLFKKNLKIDNTHKVNVELQPGQSVRMANYKETFDRGYLPNWSDEILTINRMKKGNPRTYKVKDDKGEQFEGSFYREDLGRIRRDKETTYRIKILKKRIKNGIEERLVKFIGYSDPPKWIPKNDIV